MNPRGSLVEEEKACGQRRTWNRALGQEKSKFRADLLGHGQVKLFRSIASWVQYLFPRRDRAAIPGARYSRISRIDGNPVHGCTQPSISSRPAVAHFHCITAPFPLAHASSTCGTIRGAFDFIISATVVKSNGSLLMVARGETLFK